MKIILSPTKTFSTVIDQKGTMPYFHHDAYLLNQRLRALSKDDIIKGMNLSHKLSDEVYHYIHNFDKVTTKAILAYHGHVFKMLDIATLDQQTCQYLDTHVYILSGLYGILRPSDLISYYRLEMKDTTLFNLYDYWRPKIAQFLADELKGDMIINLASEEYHKVLTYQKMINIDFLILKQGKLLRQAMMMKTMRGLFTRHILVNRIEDVETIKKIVIKDFYYDQSLSDEKTYVYVRKTL